MKNLKSKFNRLSNYDRPYGSKDNVLMGNKGNKKSAIKIKRLGVGRGFKEDECDYTLELPLSSL